MKNVTIEGISLSRLLNAEHLALAQKILAILKKYAEAFPELKKYITQLEALIQNESNTYKTLGSSAFTDEKAKADVLRDNAARQLKRHVWAYEVSDNAREAEAARLLGALLRDVTDIIEEANETKTVDLNNLISRMTEEPFAAATQTLGAENLVKKLFDKNTEYNKISVRQTEADAEKSAGNMNAVRKPVDEELHRIFRMIQYRFDVETADEYVKSCVNEINYDIRETLTKMKQRTGRIRKDDMDDVFPKDEPADDMDDSDMDNE
jgi:hypothetical protein